MQETSLNPHHPVTAENHAVTDKIAVIIPFYQEEPGILRRALESVCAQTGVSDVEVIVVDDGSPVSASKELRDLAVPSHISLRIIKQDNAGPGAARNKGLDGVSDDAKYVAFLDSDDEWYPEHLSSAINALEIGYDFYFANMRDPEQRLLHFRIHEVNLEHHAKVPGRTRLFVYNGDILHDIINSNNFISTPTIVYKLANLSSIRFPEHIFMGEDLTFLIEIASATRNIIFSPDVCCICGSGINIYKNSGWDSERHLWRLLHYMVWRKSLFKNFDLTDKQKRANVSRIKDLRQEFIAGFWHKARRLQIIRFGEIFGFVCTDPVVLLSFFPTTISLLISKPKNK